MNKFDNEDLYKMPISDWNLEASEEARIERRTTTEYPIRYCAFDQPRVLFVAQVTALKDSRSQALAAYHEPLQNKDYPLLVDGIYAEICNYQGKSYLAEVHATQPQKGRAQKTEHRFFSDFMQAVTWIELQIPIYRCFCMEVKT